MALLFIFLFSLTSSYLFPLSDTVDVYNSTLSNSTTFQLDNASLHLGNDTVANFTFTWSNGSNIIMNANESVSPESQQVDCFGLGSTIAGGLEWFFKGNANGSNALDVRFFFSSRKQPRRVEVLVGKQFGLEWVDFRMERRTVFIVHGFLSHSNETWIRKMEEAFLLWGDVNVVVVDWSAGGNSWNYYKAVVNTRIVGYQMTRFLGQLMNATIEAQGPDSRRWGSLHLVGHSLGAHICGYAAKRFNELQNKWIVKRITGLDPAQPCFREGDLAMQLDKSDAFYVDIIHTNARLLSNLGLGLPDPIGHADFYPNGGMKQPGCSVVQSSFFRFLPISKSKIEQTICSHGRSYLYLTESLISAVRGNCTFWAHHWDLTYRSALQAATRSCDSDSCAEMGIKAELYPQRGTFFVVTGDSTPFCAGNATMAQDKVTHLLDDLMSEQKD